MMTIISEVVIGSGGHLQRGVPTLTTLGGGGRGSKGGVYYYMHV